MAVRNCLYGPFHLLADISLLVLLLRIKSTKSKQKTKSHFDLIILQLLNRQRFTVKKGKSAFLMSRMILKGTSVMHLRLWPGLNKLDAMERERALITQLHLECLLA